MSRFKGIKKTIHTNFTEISQEEFRMATFEIFKKFADFCNQNGLRYFLAGGTLIGAVRHHGFVPWDDDMDITMPRPDFEKLRELTQNGKLCGYKRMSIHTTPEEQSKPFDRIVDVNYYADIKTPEACLYAWIDIQPWDGLPAESSKHWMRIQRYKQFANLARRPIKKANGNYKLIKKLLNSIIYWLDAPFRLIGPVYFAKKR